jgi:hypothetical protein
MRKRRNAMPTDLSREDAVLLGLTTLGPDGAYEVPGVVVDLSTGHREGAALAPDVGILDALVQQGLAYHPHADPRRYKITDRGGDRVLAALGVLGRRPSER